MEAAAKPVFCGMLCSAGGRSRSHRGAPSEASLSCSVRIVVLGLAASFGEGQFPSG